MWELDLLERPLDVGDNRAEIAAFHIGVDVNAPRLAFTIDGIGSRHDAYISHICKPHLLPARCVDQKVLTIAQTVATFGLGPHVDVVGSIAGLFLGVPGVLFGPFIGAVLGELSSAGSLRQATRAGFGATVGLILGAAIKLALAFSMIGIFVAVRFVR